MHSPVYSDDALTDLISMTHPSGPAPTIHNSRRMSLGPYSGELVELSNESSPLTTVALAAADPARGVIYLVIHARSVVSKPALDMLARIGATARLKSAG